MSAESQADWVRRVLGVQVGPPGDHRTSLLAVWREAKEQVDSGIGALQGRMRQHPLPALGRIADRGLNGITDTRSVGMIAALMEADRNPAASGNARKAVAAFRSFIATDTAAAIDENPFGVEVALRRTLGAALDTIERQLGG